MRPGAWGFGPEEVLAWFAAGVPLALALAPGLSAQSVAAAKSERDPPDDLGYYIAPLNDVDGDGCADFVLGDGEHLACVISGKTSTIIATDTDFPGAITSLNGDVDGDGIWDLVKWSPDTAPVSRPDLECLPAICSGKDLHSIRRCRFPFAHSLANGTAVATGDIDGDSKPDIAFGIQSTPWGAVLIFSGATGQLLREIKGESGDRNNARLACADLDRDGKPDLMLGPNPWLRDRQSSFVRIILSRPGVQAITVKNQSNWNGMGAALGAVPDVDGDGWDDVLIVQLPSSAYEPAVKHEPETATEHSRDAATAVIISSRTGKPVRSLAMQRRCDCEDASSAVLDDVDQDGVRDFAIAGDCYIRGEVVIYSGKTGAILREHGPTFDEPAPNATVSRNGRFAVSVLGLGDTDGDDVGDYAIGASGNRMGAGCFSIYSGKTGALLHAIWKRDLVKK